MTMNESNSVTKGLIRRMTVDEASTNRTAIINETQRKLFLKPLTAAVLIAVALPWKEVANTAQEASKWWSAIGPKIADQTF